MSLEISIDTYSHDTLTPSNLNTCTSTRVFVFFSYALVHICRINAVSLQCTRGAVEVLKKWQDMHVSLYVFQLDEEFKNEVLQFYSKMAALNDISL